MKRGSRRPLPADHSLVAWDAAATEIGVHRVTVFTLVRQGKLQRHPSRRGVTRDSVQSVIADRTTKYVAGQNLLPIIDVIAHDVGDHFGVDPTDVAQVVLHSIARVAAPSKHEED